MSANPVNIEVTPLASDYYDVVIWIEASEIMNNGTWGVLLCFCSKFRVQIACRHIVIR